MNTQKSFSAIFTLLLSSLLLFSCGGGTENTNQTLSTGTWRAVIQTQGVEVPFNFEVSPVENGKYAITLINGEERLLADEVAPKGDSLYIQMHIFDASIRAKITSEGLTGTWSKDYVEDYILPFSATPNNETRFEVAAETSPEDFSGEWAITITKDDGKSYPALGIFEQNGQEISGTVMTNTGDYRYLVGNVSGKSLYLSTFDGEHAYLFKATKNDDETLKGEFFLGKTGYRTWEAKRDSTFSLSDSYTLTYLKEGYDKFDFTFKNMTGEDVSLSDPKYQGKVVLVQIFGTWCPNCMDETKYLAKWYEENKDRGVEIIALSFEQKNDYDYAKSRISRIQERIGAKYEFLFAGSSDNEEAAKSLPMLNAVVSFPTLIYVDKKGEVAKIHTGFSGPGTGSYYDKWVKEHNELVDGLLGQE
ncbi:peroxiredoxin family protein [Penaeicola halotolerans]|uniref:peroxiredoxin family protein n=1 Tax=Penaeicola halotolerans TaxID=2793196 RepID=UPI001CF874F1|nr:TlpA disulfide reductase family protein [Penaeicola halotolerans]